MTNENLTATENSKTGEQTITANKPLLKTADEIMREYPDIGIHRYGLKQLARSGKIKTVKFGRVTYINVAYLFDYLNGNISG